FVAAPAAPRVALAAILAPMMAGCVRARAAGSLPRFLAVGILSAAGTLVACANFLVATDLARGVGLERWHGLLLAAPIALVLAWRGGSRWRQPVLVGSVGLLAIAVVAVAVATGATPWRAWTRLASRPVVAFDESSVWVTQGRTLSTPTSVTLTEAQRMTATSIAMWRVVPGDEGDRSALGCVRCGRRSRSGARSSRRDGLHAVAVCRGFRSVGRGTRGRHGSRDHRTADDGGHDARRSRCGRLVDRLDPSRIGAARRSRDRGRAGRPRPHDGLERVDARAGARCGRAWPGARRRAAAAAADGFRHRRGGGRVAGSRRSVAVAHRASALRLSRAARDSARCRSRVDGRRSAALTSRSPRHIVLVLVVCAIVRHARRCFTYTPSRISW